jgi:hypothetical protein
LYCKFNKLYNYKTAENITLKNQDALVLLKKVVPKIETDILFRIKMMLHEYDDGFITNYEWKTGIKRYYKINLWQCIFIS